MRNSDTNPTKLIIAIGILLSSCSRISYSPTAPPDLTSQTPITSSTPLPSATFPPLTETPAPERTLIPVDAAYQIVQNDSLSTGTNHWGQRVGDFSHSTSQYYTEPGSGLIITSGTDYAGVAGQCVPVQNLLADWPTTRDQKQITFEAYLKTDSNIYQVTLLIIFHQEDCDRPGQFHTQVGTMQSDPIPGNQDWTQISTSGIIPDDALSVDIIIWALGKNDTARAYFDDVRSYPNTPE